MAARASATLRAALLCCPKILFAALCTALRGVLQHALAALRDALRATLRTEL
jgi:hypothetical protein